MRLNLYLDTTPISICCIIRSCEKTKPPVKTIQTRIHQFFRFSFTLVPNGKPRLQKVAWPKQWEVLFGQSALSQLAYDLIKWWWWFTSWWSWWWFISSSSWRKGSYLEDNGLASLSRQPKGQWSPSCSSARIVPCSRENVQTLPSSSSSSSTTTTTTTKITTTKITTTKISSTHIVH